MNIILWNCSTDLGSMFRPAGAHVIAAWLRANAITVKVIDFSNYMSTSDLVRITKQYISDETLAIGISTTFWEQISQGNKIEGGFIKAEPQWVLNARSQLTDFKGDWILGGSAGSAISNTLPWIQFNNESEDAILSHLNFKRNRISKGPKFSILTQNSDYHASDFIQPYEVLPLELSRGCMFSCKFCGYENIGKKKGTYIRTKETIRRQLLENYERHGTTTYTLADDTVNESRDKISDLADIAQSLPFELKWGGFLRLDLLHSYNNLSVLKDSGFKTCYFGIETFHPQAAKAIGKGWNSTPECKSLLIQLAKDTSVSIHLAFIIGLPEETRQDLYNTYNWCKDNGMMTLSIHALGLDRSTKRVDSYFSRNYADYNYSFPTDNNFYWKSNIMDHTEAVEISKDITFTQQQWLNNKISAFNAALTAGPAHHLGMSYNDVFSLRNDFYSTEEWKRANQIILHQYIDAHKI